MVVMATSESFPVPINIIGAKIWSSDSDMWISPQSRVPQTNLIGAWLEPHQLKLLAICLRKLIVILLVAMSTVWNVHQSELALAIIMITLEM